MSVRLTKTAIKKGVKTCRVCKKTKSIGEFVLNLKNKWMPNDCRECEKKRQHERYKLRGNHNQLYKEELNVPRPNACEGCGREGKTTYDHCHITNLHRGWLCSKCNTIVGFAGDDPDRLRALAEYLEKFYRSESILDLLKAEEEENMILYLPI